MAAAKRKSTRRKKPPTLTMRQIAADVGYKPGQFSIARMASQIETIKRWGHDISHGVVPPELDVRNIETARKMLRMEMQDVLQQEMRMLEYFHPKRKSVDVAGEDGDPIEMVIRWDDEK